MSLKSKLNRLKPHLTTGDPAEKERALPETFKKMEIPFLERWKQEQVVPYFFDDNYCLIREVKYPLSHQHGRYRFQDFITAIETWNNSTVGHPLSANGHKPEQLFFFDTETTGLGGGVGNTIFILGYASVLGEELIVRQHILPNPGAEVSLYHSFLEKVNYRTLVTYNGKSFDWPQVKTRHTLVREHVPKLPAFGHFDLFHAAKRLWKHKLERLKLSVVEKEVLEVERVEDIPGYLAPMIYFDFIESKQPDGMLGVLKHNEIDILSLVTLYTHLTFQICGTDRQQTNPESYEVGRWFASLGESEEAEQILQRLTKEDDQTSYQAKFLLAYQQKQQQNWLDACHLFADVVEFGEDTMKIEACVELAKLYEHRLKDQQRALYFCEQAINILIQLSPAVKLKKNLSIKFLRIRLHRLERKAAKFPG